MQVSPGISAWTVIFIFLLARHVHSAKHIPVLTSEVLDLLKPGPGSVVVDCTVGLGGHGAAIASRLGGSGLLIGLDVDENALEIARDRLKEFGQTVRLLNSSFAKIGQILSELGIEQVNAIFADLGVSSLQLEQADRGFSFQQPGPLDMRMDQTAQLQAADLVNSLQRQPLADLLYRYGQETRSRKIARLICQKRRACRIETTDQLAEIVCQALGTRYVPGSSRIHPATKTFQALRIAVNKELENLKCLLDQAPRLLSSDGRISIISFHSLEDGMVKDDFRLRATEGHYTILTKKPLGPSESEKLRNRRSRSAKLRAAQRTARPAEKMR